MKTVLTTKPSISPSYEPAGSRPIDLRRAMEIPGSLGEVELRWLASVAANSLAVIEIGANLGRVTRALADHALGWVHAVELWPSQETYTIFRNNLKDREDRVFFNHNTAKNAFLGLSLRLPQGADLVFISGLYSVPVIRETIHTYEKLVCPGGIIAGGGYGTSREITEFVRAQLRNVEHVGQLWFARA